MPYSLVSSDRGGSVCTFVTWAPPGDFILPETSERTYGGWRRDATA